MTRLVGHIIDTTEDETEHETMGDKDGGETSGCQRLG